MILTADQKIANASTYSKIDAGIRSAIQTSSVLLKGPAAGGAGTFKGSGVILYYDKPNGQTLVLTAKHNLYVFANQTDPPAWSDTTVNQFQQNIQICYAAKMDWGTAPDQTAPITSATPINLNAGPNSWLYDVMLLKSNDAELNYFAAKHYCYDPNLSVDYMNFMGDPTKYLKRGTGRYFVQTGFGKVRDKAEDSAKTPLPKGTAADNVEDTFQYRMTEPIAAAVASVFHQQTNGTTFYQHDNCAQLTADATTSTAPGDSGGPLFVTFYDEAKSDWKLYLIGVTTGSDMATTATKCPRTGYILENNISTSLAYCYMNSLFG